MHGMDLQTSFRFSGDPSAPLSCQLRVKFLLVSCQAQYVNLFSFQYLPYKVLHLIFYFFNMLCWLSNVELFTLYAYDAPRFPGRSIFLGHSNSFFY